MDSLAYKIIALLISFATLCVRIYEEMARRGKKKRKRKSS
jgi:hypothetical protein